MFALILKAFNLTLRWGGGLFLALGVAPNTITLSSVVVGALASGIFIYNHNIFLFAGIALFGTFLDALDGEVARRSGRVTGFGAYLDAMSDRVFEAVTLLGAATVSGHWTASFLLLAVTNLVSYAKSWTAMVRPISNHNWPALMGREGRCISLTVGLLAWGFFPDQRFAGKDLFFWALVLMSAATLLTALQRMAYARKLILESEGAL